VATKRTRCLGGPGEPGRALLVLAGHAHHVGEVLAVVDLHLHVTARRRRRKGQGGAGSM
jgi:hypothetical protein